MRYTKPQIVLNLSASDVIHGDKSMNKNPDAIQGDPTYTLAAYQADE